MSWGYEDGCARIFNEQCKIIAKSANIISSADAVRAGEAEEVFTKALSSIKIEGSLSMVPLYEEAPFSVQMTGKCHRNGNRKSDDELDIFWSGSGGVLSTSGAANKQDSTTDASEDGNSVVPTNSKRTKLQTSAVFVDQKTLQLAKQIDISGEVCMHVKDLLDKLASQLAAKVAPNEVTTLEVALGKRMTEQLMSVYCDGYNPLDTNLAVTDEPEAGSAEAGARCVTQLRESKRKIDKVKPLTTVIHNVDAQGQDIIMIRNQISKEGIHIHKVIMEIAIERDLNVNSAYPETL